MAIQWFPGHMHLTQKAIAERIKDIDVVIELLDARLPGSSANPMLADLTGHKAGLKVLNKQDLADPERTALWLAHYNAQPATRAIGLDASLTTPARQLIDACHELSPLREGDIVTVDFHVDLPELYPASFSFSPAIADGTLMGYQMCDWIDNAITLQMGRSEAQIYGYIHLPCRVEVNARIRTERQLENQLG